MVQISIMEGSWYVQGTGANKSGDVFLYSKSHLRSNASLPPIESLRSFSIHGKFCLFSHILYWMNLACHAWVMAPFAAQHSDLHEHELSLHVAIWAQRYY